MIISTDFHAASNTQLPSEESKLNKEKLDKAKSKAILIL